MYDQARCTIGWGISTSNSTAREKPCSRYSVMYGDGGPPGHQGKPPSEVWARSSLASAERRCAAATRGSSTRNRSSPSRPPRAATRQGVSSRAILRLGSAASQGSNRVSRADSSRASRATAGYWSYRLVRTPVDRNRLRVCSVHS